MLSEFSELSVGQQESVLDHLSDHIEWNQTTLVIDGEPTVEFDVKIEDGEYAFCNPGLVSKVVMKPHLSNHVSFSFNPGPSGFSGKVVVTMTYKNRDYQTYLNRDSWEFLGSPDQFLLEIHVKQTLKLKIADSTHPLSVYERIFLNTLIDTF